MVVHATAFSGRYTVLSWIWRWRWAPSLDGATVQLPRIALVSPLLLLGVVCIVARAMPPAHAASPVRTAAIESVGLPAW